jgi:hypothetical protein
MKITKENLRQIIKEELEAVLEEGLDYFDKSRDICKRRGSGYRDGVEMVR